MNYEKRTRAILTNSLNELIQYRRFEDITVKDIVNNCDVSRVTFYRYFKDKYELMTWYYQNELNTMLYDSLRQNEKQNIYPIHL